MATKQSSSSSAIKLKNKGKVSAGGGARGKNPRPAPVKTFRPSIVVRSATMANGQPRPKRY